MTLMSFVQYFGKMSRLNKRNHLEDSLFHVKLYMICRYISFTKDSTNQGVKFG